MSALHYNVTGERRKALVRAVSEILGEDAVYLGVPTFSYQVDFCMIDRAGTVTIPDIAPITATELSGELRKYGFALGDAPEDDNSFAVEISRDGFPGSSYRNLQNLIHSKATLLKRVLETDELEIKILPDKLIFPWFTLHGLEGEEDAYTRLVTGLCRMANSPTKINAKERITDNPKFSFRVFLKRLGFVGDEYKLARKILLQDLPGNGSWRYGSPPNRASRNAPYEK